MTPRAILAASLFVCHAVFPRLAEAQGAREPLTADQLLSITSVISGAPTWSPDGESILITSTVTGGLATLPAKGGFPTLVPIDTGGAGHFLASQMPEYSPTGRWVSYVSDKSGAPEIWLWSTEDGSEQRVTDLGARINSMSWSPDEKWIAFAGDRYGNYDVWKVSAPGGEVHRLTDDERYEVFPSWTPDAQRILYVRLDEAWVDHDVIEIGAEGQGARTVLSDRDFFDYGAGTRFGYPQVSADGQHVLFPSHRSGWVNYWVAPLEGGAPRPVARAEADQHEARFSPDGRWIAYTENHDGQYDLRVVSASGGEPRLVVSKARARVASPEW